jgi:hypothetical protein
MPGRTARRGHTAPFRRRAVISSSTISSIVTSTPVAGRHGFYRARALDQSASHRMPSLQYGARWEADVVSVRGQRTASLRFRVDGAA